MLYQDAPAQQPRLENETLVKVIGVYFDRPHLIRIRVEVLVEEAEDKYVIHKWLKFD